jgi:hypothetical protein
MHAAQNSVDVHGKKFCPNPVGNAGQPPATSGTQKAFPLAFGVHNAPVDAPANVLRLIESEAQALAVSIAAKHHKLDYIAACIGKSRGYVSRLQSGKRPIPDKLVGPLCAATGSNLLRQYRHLQAALGEVCEVQRLADMLRSAAA